MSEKYPDQIPVGRHKDVEILYETRMGRFCASLEGGTVYSETLKGVQKRIDATLHKKAKSRTLDLAVVNQSMESLTVRGFNLHTGDFTGTEGVTRHYTSDPLYPDTQYVRQLLARRQEIYTQLKAVDKLLEPLRFLRHRSNRLGDEVEHYEREIDQLEQHYNDLRQKALGPEELLQ